jgi:hypothetical protein
MANKKKYVLFKPHYFIIGLTFGRITIVGIFFFNSISTKWEINKINLIKNFYTSKDCLNKKGQHKDNYI